MRDLNHKGKFVAVLTCKGREWLNKDLKSNPDVSSALFASVTPSECQAKPSPEGILHLLDQSGVEADKAVMIGDSLSDMMAAVNAGIDGIAVNFCHLGREEELLSAGANELFTSVEDLANRLLLK